MSRWVGGFQVQLAGGGQSGPAGGGSGPAGGGGSGPGSGGVRSRWRGGQVQPGGGQSAGGSASCALLRAVCLLRSRRRTFLFAECLQNSPEINFRFVYTRFVY